MADEKITRQPREVKSFVDMTAEEQEREIQSCAAYLLEKKERLLMQRPTIESLNNHPRKAECIYTYAEMIGKLEDIKTALNQAVEGLNDIESHFVFGRLEPYFTADLDISLARKSAISSLASTLIAIGEVKEQHPPKTRELTLHKSAARLAHAHFIKKDRDKARKLAHRIIEAAGLDSLDESTLTRWLQEFNKEDDAAELRHNANRYY